MGQNTSQPKKRGRSADHVSPPNSGSVQRPSISNLHPPLVPQSPNFQFQPTKSIPMRAYPHILNIITPQPVPVDQYGNPIMVDMYRKTSMDGLGPREPPMNAENLHMRDIKEMNSAINFAGLMCALVHEEKESIQLKGGPLLGFNAASISEQLPLNPAVIGGMSFSTDLNDFCQKFKVMVGEYNVMTPRGGVSELVGDPRLRGDKNRAIAEFRREAESIRSRGSTKTGSQDEYQTPPTELYEKSSAGKGSMHRRTDSALLRKLLGKSLERESVAVKNAGIIGLGNSGKKESTLSSKQSQRMEGERKTSLSPGMHITLGPNIIGRIDQPNGSRVSHKNNKYPIAFAPAQRQVTAPASQVSTQRFSNKSPLRLESEYNNSKFVVKQGPSNTSPKLAGLNYPPRSSQSPKESSRDALNEEVPDLFENKGNQKVAMGQLDNWKNEINDRFPQSARGYFEKEEDNSGFYSTRSRNGDDSVISKGVNRETRLTQTKSKVPIVNGKYGKNTQPQKTSNVKDYSEQVRQRNKEKREMAEKAQRAQLEASNKYGMRDLIDSPALDITGNGKKSQHNREHPEPQTIHKDFLKRNNEKSPNRVSTQPMPAQSQSQIKRFDLATIKPKGPQRIGEVPKKQVPEYIMKLPTDSLQKDSVYEVNESQIPVRSDAEADESNGSSDDFQPVEATLDLSAYLKTPTPKSPNTNSRQALTVNERAVSNGMQGNQQREVVVRERAIVPAPIQTRTEVVREREEFRRVSPTQGNYMGNRNRQTSPTYNSDVNWQQKQGVSKEILGAVRGSPVNYQQNAVNYENLPSNFHYKKTEEELDYDAGPRLIEEVKTKLDRLSSRLEGMNSGHLDSNYTSTTFNPTKPYQGYEPYNEVKIPQIRTPVVKEQYGQGYHIGQQGGIEQLKHYNNYAGTSLQMSPTVSNQAGLQYLVNSNQIGNKGVQGMQRIPYPSDRKQFDQS